MLCSVFSTNIERKFLLIFKVLHQFEFEITFSSFKFLLTLQDPREALIVRLKRQVGILEQENTHLRKLMDLSEIQGRVVHAAMGTPMAVPAPGSEGFEDKNLSDFELDEVSWSRYTF